MEHQRDAARSGGKGMGDREAARRWGRFLAAMLAASLLASASGARAASQEKVEPSPFQRNAALFNMKCAKCHTIGNGRRVGPDLRGSADRHDHDWLVGFLRNPDAYLDKDPVAKKLLADSNGVRMENTGLTAEQAEGLIAYIRAASILPAPPEEPAGKEEEPLYRKLRMPDEGLQASWPGLALALLLLAGAIGLARLRDARAGALLAIAAAGAAYWSLGGRHYHRLLGNQQGYEPLQPIAFSHALHAGQLKISCYYCHSNVERSDVAGVPAAAVCMNCHKAVRAVRGSSTPSPEIAKLIAYVDGTLTGKPHSVEWTRVHHLPDFVHFSHRAHVANNIQCQECHGPVQEMPRMRQAASLSMGWCIQCHRQKEGAAPTHWKRAGGPLDCAACHW